MVGSSKILTVSYGTFSCTLEGFDDSFDTMKAIAEYFRDLAADDRYFGAEPPTPDADMLARIAEREIARRVEAHEHQGRIVLRAQDNATVGTALASAPGPAPEHAPETEAAPESEAPIAKHPAPDVPATPGEAPAPEAEAAPVNLPPPDIAADTIADTSASLPMADAPEGQDSADHDAQDAAALAALEPEGIELEDDGQVPETADDTAPAPLAEASEDAAPPPAAEADDLGARLDLIRSVVGAADSYDEDEHAQDFADTAGSSPIAWDTPGDGDDDAMPPEPPEADAFTAIAPETGEQTQIAEGDDHAVQPEPVAQEEDGQFEDTLAALLADAAPMEAPTTEAPPTEPAEAGDEPPADTTDRPGARVVKVSRADVEAARAAGLIDTGAETGEDTVNIFGDEADVLSPEDEAELQRELASLDAEIDDDLHDDTRPEGAVGPGNDPEGGTDDSTPARDEGQPTAPGAQPETGKRSEVSRIFDETDSQLADPGSVRRRNTIQHLRAALAATRAEKEAGTDLTKKVDSTPYRGDLDAAVRPRRALAAPDAPRSARPEEPRPAPLKLVAEQRVDKPRGPVRPRRVTVPAQAEVVEAQDQDFSAFAAELGATDLPDLLEAAAAYLVDIEGRSQFSRPMLMGKLREIDEDGFSREDGLRSFGQLLREGKLQKLSGGRFAVTDETEFRDASRRRAG